MSRNPHGLGATLREDVALPADLHDARAGVREESVDRDGWGDRSWSAPRARTEGWSEGIDELLQLTGSDPYDGTQFTGLRVPTLPTVDQKHRYLFMLDAFTLGEGARARITGYRQLVTIGLTQTGSSTAPRLVEQVVESPVFRFQDGNVSWHLRRIDPTNLDRLRTFAATPAILQTSGIQIGPLRAPNLAFRMSNTPALLYTTPGTTLGMSGFYFDLAAYTPPNLGRPYGQPVGHLGTFHDLRTGWRTHGAWPNSLQIDCEGPGMWALFASVRQTNPSTRVALIAPAVSSFYSCGLSCEEQFLLNFPTAIYWRVAGSLIVQLLH